jgi:hypothetical protein
MSFCRVTDEAGGVALDYTNDTKGQRDIDYASATAPEVCYVWAELYRKGSKKPEIIDGVYVGDGDSHSWWSGAHGKLLRRGLMPGERLRVLGDGVFAFRWDWTDE